MEPDTSSRIQKELTVCPFPEQDRAFPCPPVVFRNDLFNIIVQSTPWPYKFSVLQVSPPLLALYMPRPLVISLVWI
jgi:hypothetical protein